MGRSLTFWQALRRWFRRVREWFVSLFQESRPVETEYRETVNQLVIHMGTYLEDSKPIPRHSKSGVTDHFAEKHNAALSLIKALNPDARFRGEKITVPGETHTAFQNKNSLVQTYLEFTNQKKVDEELSQPVTTWVKNHGIGARYEAEDLNYHRTRFGRFFQSIFGRSRVKTRTMKLIDEAYELEQYRMRL